MTTKRKRGPVIKTDWMLETDPGIYRGPIETKNEAEMEKKSRLDNFLLNSRIIERKWRVVG